MFQIIKQISISDLDNQNKHKTQISMYNLILLSEKKLSKPTYPMWKCNCLLILIYANQGFEETSTSLLHGYGYIHEQSSLLIFFVTVGGLWGGSNLFKVNGS